MTKGALVNGPVAAAVVNAEQRGGRHQRSASLVRGRGPDRSPIRESPRRARTASVRRTAAYDAPTGLLKTLPNYLFWMVFLFVFSYLGANLPIWRFAQPVNYIGFWITSITILLVRARDGRRADPGHEGRGR